MKKLNVVISAIILLYSLAFPLFYFFPSINSSPLALYYLLFPLIIVLAIIWVIRLITVLLKSFATKTPISPDNRLSIYLFMSALLIYPIAYSLPTPLPSGSFEKKFDKDLWSDSVFVHSNQIYTERQKMVGDLINYILPNKNKASIIDILGTPLKNNIDNSGEMIIYELGPERDGFMNLDTEILEIYFDKNAVYKKSVIQVY